MLNKHIKTSGHIAKCLYKDNSQLQIGDFVFPYRTLDWENDWVKLARIVPWETIEEGYAA